MAGTIFIYNDSFELRADGRLIGVRRTLDANALRALQLIATRYVRLNDQPDVAETLAIGRDLYRWLDGSQGELTRLIGQASRPLILSIHCVGTTPSDVEWMMLHAPWELMANEQGYLASDHLLQFSPQRRLGPIDDPVQPDDYRLGLAFMAAAPNGVTDLDYEAEEAAILDAVGNTSLDLLVEESGQSDVLCKRLFEAGTLPVLHLSCHGHNAWRQQPDAVGKPVLFLEDDKSEPSPTDVGELLRTLRPALPHLLFLSACLTSATPSREGVAGLPPEPNSKEGQQEVEPESAVLAHSLTSALIQAGLPAIIGWDGTVADVTATRFAAELYRRLANREALSLAVADARRALLEVDDERVRRHWHLARLWLGGRGDGGAPLVTGSRKRSLLSADYAAKDMLGKEVPVASHAMFVGRRRELQQAIHCLDDSEHAGVLFTGMGRLGKSSLAARIVNRRRNDLMSVVMHGPFGVQQLVEKLSEAAQEYPKAREVLRDGAALIRRELEHGEAAALVVLSDVLSDLLYGPCKQKDVDGPPLLLILDDFEQLLQQVAGVRPVHGQYAGLIATILRAFDPTRTDSRLLITCRFPISVSHGAEELAARLKRIELKSFKETEVRKLTLRQQMAAQSQESEDLADRHGLVARALAAARGNPGLLDLLVGRLVLNPLVPVTGVKITLDEMDAYLTGGDLPALESVREFLEHIAVETLLGLAGTASNGLLRAMTVFELSVPRPVIHTLAKAIGGEPQRLIDLALIEPDNDPVDRTVSAIRVSPLAAARVDPLSAEERLAIAQAVTQPLFATWGGRKGRRPAAADLQLVQLALASDDSQVGEACGVEAIRALESVNYQTAAELANNILSLVEEPDRPTPLDLLATAARVFAGIGDGAKVDQLLREGIEAIKSGQKAMSQDALPILDEYATRLFRRGELDEALRIRQQEELPVYERLGDVHSTAVTKGQIADILHARGELDEALRIRQQEQLPVYERLGDVREQAVTKGKIADILQARGELDEALHIRQQEQLPVYERLGDVREQAVTKGKIADILQARGELDEALHIRQQEQLPVYERLGDVREQAVTKGKIADILQARGELDEALRIRQQEQLPVYERLGDVRSTAVTKGQIADILHARGELDEALRIRQQEELPVYERLGDVRSTAVTKGKIADILHARGELDEALRIRQQEQLPVYERLGDVRSTAVTKGKIADILHARGELDEALRIRQQEELPVYERLGDVHSTAVTKGQIADILHARGELDEALRIRQQEELPVYERLGDVRSTAVTKGQIADILHARGELDEALRIRQQEELPVYERLGDVRSTAVTKGQIADILHARGELDEALHIRQQEQLPVYERLGDVRSTAVTKGKIADILHARGELDEALRIRQQEQLPVYERLGDVRTSLICRVEIAMNLISKMKQTPSRSDSGEVNELLCRALTDAHRLRIPEAAQIEKILDQLGMDCKSGK